MRPIMISLSPLFNVSLFKDHSIIMGKSPFDTEHCMPTESPELEASSPKENGFIWGGTKRFQF